MYAYELDFKIENIKYCNLFFNNYYQGLKIHRPDIK